MKSPALGKNTSSAEVENISRHGIWLLVKGREYFLAYGDYPWFADAKLSEIHNVKLLRGKYLHWPDLDVDLELDSLSNREQYPLLYKP